MLKIFSPPTVNTTKQIVCCYCNRTEQTIIARITNLDEHDCERVVFPQECFFFTAPYQAKLEIYRQSALGVLQELIPCLELQIPKSR
ncbi:DUF1830 domain-containing protein [Gloeothece verrucosa]|uniref:Uncharacterized protein n=1 Tax=Gloeothece verrucosa (strain PCC 7822) TaxID=497965 RepID=E0U953_GLOV7|nr:DUF1830 domain-containing protein [Gloeothece verrucosa]ADN17311.1 Domain of unknown function DUF1830 [Gloeothece verrucosa PCC 7822]